MIFGPSLVLPVLPARPADVVVFGENSVDFVGRTSRSRTSSSKVALTSLDVLPGGQAATAAIGCARLGLRTTYVGTFGNDDRASLVIDALTRERVNVVPTFVEGAATRVAIVLVDDATGERMVYEYRHHGLDETDVDPKVWARGRVLLVDATDTKTSTLAARAARASGTVTAVDADRFTPAVDALLSHIDVVIVPDDFVHQFSDGGIESGARELAERHACRLVVVTLGRDGSLAVADGHTIRTPAFPVDVVDSTGAGDAFRAGFIAAWTRAREPIQLEDVLRCANACAALNCRAKGAQAGLPTWEELQALAGSIG